MTDPRSPRRRPGRRAAPPARPTTPCGTSPTTSTSSPTTVGWPATSASASTRTSGWPGGRPWSSDPDRPVVASVAYDLPACPTSGWASTAAAFEVDTDVESPLDRVRRPRVGAGRDPRRSRPTSTADDPGDADHPGARPHLDDRRGALPVRRHHPLRDPVPGRRHGHRGRRACCRSRATASATTPGASATGGPSGGAGSPAASTTAPGCTGPTSASRATRWPSGYVQHPAGDPVYGHRARRHRGDRRRRAAHLGSGPHRARRASTWPSSPWPSVRSS